MNSIEKLEWRYATKKFDNTKKLSNNQIDILKNTFNLTATSYGLQPLKMVVISNDNIKNDLRKHSFDQPQITDCSHLLVICMKTNINAGYVHEMFDLEMKIRGTKEEVINDFRTFLKNTIASKSPKELEVSAKNQAYIALGNLMAICAFEGIDSCPIEGFIPQKYDAVLNLEKHNLKSVLLLPVGYRSKEDFMSKLKKVRIPVEESVIDIF